MKKLSDSVKNETTEGLIEDTGALSCNIFFMKLNLYSINGLIVPNKHRSLYLWTFLIWFTTLGGVNITPKRILVSEAISNIFLILWYDVLKCCMCTSEPEDHGFGDMRIIYRESSCTYFVSLVEKLQRQINMIFCGDLNESSYMYGYQANLE